MSEEIDKLKKEIEENNNLTYDQCKSCGNSWRERNKKILEATLKQAEKEQKRFDDFCVIVKDEIILNDIYTADEIVRIINETKEKFK